MTSDIRWHRHHLIPRHAGGSDDPSNLVKVNVPMHVFLHEQRYKEYGCEYDRVAALCLRGRMTKEDLVLAACIEGGKSPMSEDAKRKISEYQTGQVRSPETRKRMSEGLSQPVTLNGVTYKSKTKAAKAFGVCNAAVSQWIRRGGTKNVVVG